MPMDRQNPKARGFAAALCIVALAACTTPKPSPERAMFDLGQPAVETAGSVPMRVEVSLPGWLDNGDIAYRLDYEDRRAAISCDGRPAQRLPAYWRRRVASS